MNATTVRIGIKSAIAMSALVVILAACGSDSQSSAFKEPTGPAVATLKIESGNLFFKPDKLTAPPGILQIDLKNIETGTHDLVIRGVPGFQVEVSGDGDTASSKVELKKGKYEFYCSIPGHEQAGMKGTLTVS